MTYNLNISAYKLRNHLGFFTLLDTSYRKETACFTYNILSPGINLTIAEHFWPLYNITLISCESKEKVCILYVPGVSATILKNNL
jgi:hypothetical protein